MTEDRYLLGWGTANRYWQWLIREARQDVEQTIHVAVLQQSAGSPREFDRIVGRELYHLARSMGWRHRGGRMKPREDGVRWERLVTCEGLMPRSSLERRMWYRDRQKQAESIHAAS